MSFFENSVFFGVTISIVAYGVGCILKDKLKMDIFNPVLISIVAVIAVFACAHIDYDVYYSGSQYRFQKSRLCTVSFFPYPIE